MASNVCLVKESFVSVYVEKPLLDRGDGTTVVWIGVQVGFVTKPRFQSIQFKLLGPDGVCIALKKSPVLGPESGDHEDQIRDWLTGFELYHRDLRGRVLVGEEYQFVCSVGRSRVVLRGTIVFSKDEAVIALDQPHTSMTYEEFEAWQETFFVQKEDDD